MEGELEEIREVLKYHNAIFNKGHARIYLCLLSGEVKTGRQIIDETGVCKQTIYKYLNHLTESNLIRKTKTSPVQFFIENPVKELNHFFAQYLRKQVKLIEDKKERIRNIVKNKNDESEQHWEIRVKGGKTAIIDRKENKALNERYDAKQVKAAVDKFIDSLPDENKFAVAYAK
ncbi:MAG: helix-turn-helix domain-containing protein [Candidatus Diapherotrites archaeon]